MPVRSRIHVSDVSTSFSRSALVRSFFGTAEPVPRILARFMSLRLRARVAGVELRDRGLDLVRQVLARKLRREPDGVLDRLRARPPVADDHASFYSQARRPTVLRIAEAGPETAALG